MVLPAAVASVARSPHERRDGLGLAGDPFGEERQNATAHLGLVVERERQLVVGERAPHHAQEDALEPRVGAEERAKAAARVVRREAFEAGDALGEVAGDELENDRVLELQDGPQRPVQEGL